MVGSPAWRTGVEFLKEKHDYSERRACQLLEVARSGLQYKPREKSDERQLRERIRSLSRRHKRFGYRRIGALVRQESGVNIKRVHRIWKSEGLSLPRRRPRRKSHTGSKNEQRVPVKPNEVWSYDFVEDRTEKGGRLRMLCVIDEYTRECLTIRVEKSIGSGEVIETLEWLFMTRGVPEHIRSDNGPEFIAKQLKNWLEKQGCKTLYIEPGSPWQNAYIESFNGKFRDECLNREVFKNGTHAREVVVGWTQEYNEERPHSALGYVTPVEFARVALNTLRPTASACSTRKERQVQG